MRSTTMFITAIAATTVAFSRVQGQDTVITMKVDTAIDTTSIPAPPPPKPRPAVTTVAAGDVTSAAEVTNLPPIVIQHIRPVDMRGVNVFEAPKRDDVPFKGFTLGFGAAFAQDFQALGHGNTAAVRNVTTGGVTTDVNKLMPIGHGFNNALANLYLDAQLAKGIRVSMTSYLSARHHQETWVKDGYLLVDDSPIDFIPLNKLMQYVTVRAGHFEVNYGDEHFRRTDNGNAMFNPFVGNLIMDAFTTEIGGEVYLHGRGKLDGLLAMGGMTAGEVHGQITAPEKRSPALLGKLGFDRQVTPALRTRLMGSIFTQKRSASQTLYAGDRGGSHYYDVLENTLSSETANAWSGNIRSIYGSKLTSMVANPFVKFHGLEYFGNFEQAKGRNATETADRTWNQIANEVLYRFAGDALYFGGRYNTASGELPLTSPTAVTSNYKVGAKRTQIGGGWFMTPTLLSKIEYVRQSYNDFPAFDIRNGGKFNGFMLEGVVAF